MRLFPIRPELLLPLLLVVVAACSSPTATAPAASDAEAQRALLHQNAANVRNHLIAGVAECTFAYEKAQYTREGARSLNSEAPADKSSASDVHAEMEVGSDGRLSYRSGGRGLSGEESEETLPVIDRGIDFDPADWFNTEYERLLESTPRGTYVGESTYMGRPSLRYELLVERDATGGDAMPTGTLFVLDYVTANPYVYGEREYSVFADGRRELERQSTRNEFALLNCPTSDGYDAVGAVLLRELGSEAVERYAPILEGISSGCRLVYAEEGSTAGQVPGGGDFESEYGQRRELVLEDEGRWVLDVSGLMTYTINGELAGGIRIGPGRSENLNPRTGEWEEGQSLSVTDFDDPVWFLRLFVITDLSLVGAEGEVALPIRMIDYSYTGETEVGGRRAARYEYRKVEASEGGLRLALVAVEYFRDNPLLYRKSEYDFFPDGGLQFVGSQTLTELAVEECPE